MKRLLFIFALLALIPALGFGQTVNLKCPAVTVPVLTGDETVNAPVVSPPYPEAPFIAETDLIGDTTTIGTTWYDNQHNGTCGRMNTLEPDGWRQFVWMKGENSGASLRHVWWNGIDPGGVQVLPGTGMAIEATNRGGFPNMDFLHDTTCIVFHTTDQTSQTRIMISKSTHGGFSTSYLLPTAPHTLLWPRIQINQNQNLQVVATSQASGFGNILRQYCINSTSATWTFLDWTQTIAADVATSPVTGNNKTLWAWTRSKDYPAVGEPDPNLNYSPFNNDVYYLIDSDGLNPNFSQKVNLTNFIPPDLSLLPDTLHADKDTLRAYTCLSAFIDHNNYAHIAFTTRAYFQIEQTSYWNASIIWHWSEQYPDSFRMIANCFNPADSLYCGAWNVKAQRPSLGEDALGHLYCMYQVYDTDSTHISLGGYPSGEIYMSVSTDGGLNWSQGTNVTQTISPYHAVAGQCRSELTPTLAKKVDNYCHIEYVYDLDAGNVVQTEGAWTNNPVRYHRVPVAQIPTTPLVVQNKRLHISGPPPTPPVEIILSPINPPIVIPPMGGSFQFSVALINHTSIPQTIAAWIRIKMPNGTYTWPVLGPVQVTIPPNVTITRIRTMNIPGTWSPGLYTLIGYVNPAFSYPAADSSWFTFTKSAVGTGGPWITDATCTGEPFPGEEFPPLLRGDRGDLMVASPNPFNATTAISFELQAASHISLKVYDSVGRLVAVLVDGWREAGDHVAMFNGGDLASGVYLAKLTVGDKTTVQKVMLLK